MKLEIRKTYVLDQNSADGVEARRRLRETVNLLANRLDDLEIVEARVVKAVASNGAFTIEQWEAFCSIIGAAIASREVDHAGQENPYSKGVMDQLRSIKGGWLDLRTLICEEILVAEPFSPDGMHEPTATELAREREGVK